MDWPLATPPTKRFENICFNPRQTWKNRNFLWQYAVRYKEGPQEWDPITGTYRQVSLNDIYNRRETEFRRQQLFDDNPPIPTQLIASITRQLPTPRDSTMTSIDPSPATNITHSFTTLEQVRGTQAFRDNPPQVTSTDADLWIKALRNSVTEDIHVWRDNYNDLYAIRSQTQSRKY
jgi:hypothetical protein